MAPSCRKTFNLRHSHTQDTAMLSQVLNLYQSTPVQRALVIQGIVSSQSLN